MTDVSFIRDNRPHYDQLKLSIYRPNTLFTARVNDASISRGSRTIRVDDFSLSGTVTVADRMLLVGSVAGEQDLGKIRMKSMVMSASGTYIVVSENGDVLWQDDAFLTAQDYIEVVPVYPRIIQDPNNAEKTIFYKDYDIPYSNQNTVMGAFLCAGSHRSVELNEQGYVDVYWSASGSAHVVPGVTLSYSWDYWNGASGTSSTAQVPGFVRYTQPGSYVTKLVGNGSNGSSDTTYRYVSVTPHGERSLEKFEIKNIKGSVQEGGYTADVIIRENLGYQLYGGELVVVTDKAYYGSQQSDISFGDIYQDNTFFVGYVIKDSIQFDYKSQQLEFTISSVTDIMKQTECFVVAVNDVASPIAWFELNGLNGKTALYHYLRWHSTVLKVTDFKYVGKDYAIEFFDTDKSSLYDAINAFFEKTYMGKIMSDIHGRMCADTYPEADSDPTIKVAPKFTLIDDDCMRTPSIERRLFNDVSFIDGGGIIYERANKTSIAVLCAAPGQSPAYSGRSSGGQGLAVESQTHINTIIGNKYARLNSKYRYINVTLSGLYKLDFSPITFLTVNFPPSLTGFPVTISGTYMINEIDWEINAENGTIIPTLTLEKVTQGFPAQTVVETPVTEDTLNGGTFNYPPFELPPIYDIPLPSNPTSLKYVFVNTSPTFGLWYTDEFDQPQPRWWSLNYGITGAAINITDFHITPSGRVWAFSLYEVRTGLISDGKLEQVATFNDIFSQLTGSVGAGTPFFFDATLNPNNPEEYLIVGGIANVECQLMTINKNGVITKKRGVRPVDALSGYGGNLSFSPSRIIYTYLVFNIINATAQFNRAMNTETAFVAPNSFTRWHVNAGNSDLIFGDTMYSKDGGLTTLALGHTGTTNMYGLDTSPDGMFLMKIDDLGNKVRSSDGGTLWGNISALTGSFMPNGVVYNAESRDIWIFGSRSRNDFVVEPFKIVTTSDFGETWEDKIGNFYDFLPPYATQVKQIKAFIT